MDEPGHPASPPQESAGVRYGLTCARSDRLFFGDQATSVVNRPGGGAHYALMNAFGVFEKLIRG